MDEVLEEAVMGEEARETIEIWTMLDLRSHPVCSHFSPTNHRQLVPLEQEKMVQLQPSQVTAIILPLLLLSSALWATYAGKNEMSRFKTHSLL